MKNITLIISLLILGFNSGYSQNYNWITPGQTYLKMFIAEDGMYRIEKTDFVNAGISTTGIDPRTVKVYYKGGQIPIYFQGEQDGVFDDNDYFDFYGQRNYGGMTNTYDVNGNLVYTTDEYYNLYSDTSAYFVGWGGSYGTRYIDYNYQVSNPYPLNYFKAKVHFETEAIYWLGESATSQDYRYFLNDKFQGEGWYWRAMANNNTQSNTVNLPYCLPNSDFFEFKIFAYPTTNSSAVFNENRMMVRINNNLIDTIKRDDFNRMDTTYSFPGTFYLTGNNTITLKFTPPSTFTSARMYLDMFSITYPRRFAFDSNKISIYNLNGDTATKLFSVSGFVPANELTIYDYVNGYRITNISYANDVLNFSGKSNGKYEITNKPITNKPKRIKQRQVPNLVTNSTGVDYLLIYNKLFEAQAEQLRQYRATHDNYRTYKAETEDIYDIFNYGIEDPVALKRFSKQVYQNWQAPKVKYLTLFGRGSLDPKKILTSSTYYNNYVPVYGNPTTDGYFVNFNDNTTTYYHQVAVGRIPCFTSQEAQDIVSKIITYENQQLNLWMKNSVMITGGYYRSDQVSNMERAEYYINNILSTPPSGLNPIRVYIDDTTGSINYNYYDSVITVLNQGGVIVNYIGHAGNGYWDFTFQDPVELSNGDKLPLILSMTCFTGKNGESSTRGYGEKFLYYSEKGSIGFISTSGWSWSSSGNIYNEWCLKGINSDTLRKFGEIVKYASNKMAPDSVSFPVRNTINCFNLIGDAASVLKLPKYPEFVLNDSDIFINEKEIVLKKEFFTFITAKNFGLSADSCKVRFQILKNNQNYFIKDTIIKDFRYIDTIKYKLSIDSIGNYKIKCILDVDNWYPNENKLNNSLEYQIKVKNYLSNIIRPLNGQYFDNDTINFKILNPNYQFTNQKTILEIDTSKLFNSPELRIYFSQSTYNPVTNFNVSFNINDTSKLFYFRVKSIINSIDTLGYSEIRNFRITSNTMMQDSICVIKLNPTQISSFEKKYIDMYPNGCIIGNYTGKLFASSFGAEPWVPTLFLINDTAIYMMTSEFYSGLVIAKLSKTNARLISFKHFYFTSSSSSDSVLNFLNTFDTNHILMTVKLVPVNVTNNLTTECRNRFKQFGSTQIDNVNLLSWSVWSFISYQGLPNPIYSEAYSTIANTTANSVLYPEFKSLSGNVNIIFGTGSNWSNFSWESVLFQNTNMKFDVFGLKKDNTEHLLYQDLTNNNFISLDTVNAFTYPNLKLVAKLSIDTSGGMMPDNIPYGGIPSPILKSITFNYVPPCELAIDYSSMIKSDSIISDKDSLGLSFKYYNVGFKNCYGSVINSFLLRGNERVLLESDTNFSTIKIDSMINYKNYISFNNYLPPVRKNNEYISVFVEVMPLGQQNDLYYYNNTINTDVVVRSNLQSPGLELFADGIKIMGGEYVRKAPEISVKYSGKDVIPINFTDTSLFKILINNKLYQFNSDVSKPVTESDVVNKNKNTKSDEKNSVKKQVEIKNSFAIYPELQEGENIVKVLSRVSYETSFDSLKYNLLVSNEFFVKDFYNYPNPMNSETAFMFTLAGNSVFDCKLKIYTVSGKLIKTISAPVNIGFNQVRWDGRDEDGDVVANGVYLYKLIVEGDGKKETPVQKLVVLK